MPEQGRLLEVDKDAPPAIATILPIRGEGLTLERGKRPILKALDIEISGRGTLVLMGPNGAGKSMLARVLAGLVTPTAGCVTWGGLPPDRSRAPKLGFVFQRPVHLRRSVLANVTYALAVAGVPKSQRIERAEAALARGRIAHLARAPARVLSGGEQQLLSIARALATGPEVLILDEPTSSLDPAATTAIEDLLAEVRLQGVGVVLITHDLGQARRLADEVAFLHRGRLVERTPREQFLACPTSPQAQAFMRGEIVL
jgi:tungstate transport system ATP-binding protein